jgi:hypothetical protein
MPPLACPHLTNFFASHGTVMRYAAEKSGISATRLPSFGRWPLAATMCWPRPPASRPGRGCMALNACRTRAHCCRMLIITGGSNGTLDYGTGALDTGRLRAGYDATRGARSQTGSVS